MTSPVIQQTPSPNFNDRRDEIPVSVLVMHYTGMRSGSAALERLCDTDAEVSAHYLVEEDGIIHQLVAENKRAWHAGVGIWRGMDDINSASIGIEIVNRGHEFGYELFPDQQMAAVLALSRDIVSRHKIKPYNIIGHSDIAPLRKMDPGELFNWQMLADSGVGIWPDASEVDDIESGDFFENLQAIGYALTDKKKVTTAFQRHWQPENISGIADAETRRRAAALRKQVECLT